MGYGVEWEVGYRSLEVKRILGINDMDLGGSGD